MTIYHVCGYYDVYRLNRKLTELEKQYRIPHRCTTTDQDYIHMHRYFSSEKQDQLLAEVLWASARRQFLLKLKAKVGR